MLCYKLALLLTLSISFTLGDRLHAQMEQKHFNEQILNCLLKMRSVLEGIASKVRNGEEADLKSLESVQ